jgi:hypothetical protein
MFALKTRNSNFVHCLHQFKINIFCQHLVFLSFSNFQPFSIYKSNFLFSTVNFVSVNALETWHFGSWIFELKWFSFNQIKLEEFTWVRPPCYPLSKFQNLFLSLLINCIPFITYFVNQYPLFSMLQMANFEITSGLSYQLDEKACENTKNGTHLLWFLALEVHQQSLWWPCCRWPADEAWCWLWLSAWNFFLQQHQRSNMSQIGREKAKRERVHHQ